MTASHSSIVRGVALPSSALRRGINMEGFDEVNGAARMGESGIDYPDSSSPPLGVSDLAYALLGAAYKAGMDGVPAPQDEIRALLTAIAALEAHIPQWQPMASAPGPSRFLYYAAPWEIGIAYRALNGTIRCDGPFGAVAVKATHWTPLPLPPLNV